MHTETIVRHGKKVVLLEEGDFNKLVRDARMLADVHAYDAAKARLERGEDELIPASLIMRRLEGESPLKIWREYRGLTQEQLAAAAGVSRALVAAIETGRKEGSTSSLKKLAAALGCELGNVA